MIAAAVLVLGALSPAAEARHFRRRLEDMRKRTRGVARYGEYRVRNRTLANGARVKLIKHLDSHGEKIASSIAVFGPKGGQLRERLKLRCPVEAGSAERAAQVWSIHLRLTRSPRKMPTAAAAAVDLARRKIYYGKSGKPRPVRTAKLLLERSPNPSLESWAVNNCSEYKAVNKALLSGSRIQDLEVHTVRVSSGRPFPRCRNCQVTTAGAAVTSDQGQAPISWSE